MTKSKCLLMIAGCLSLAVALFQAVVSFSPAWSLYFGAPQEITANPGLLLVSGLVVAVIFGIWGLYGISGAGLIRRLFLLRPGLVVISAIYLLRGAMIVPECLIVLGLLPSSETVTPVSLVSSLVSLAIGVVYTLGTLGSWKDLK